MNYLHKFNSNYPCAMMFQSLNTPKNQAKTMLAWGLPRITCTH